MKLSFQHGPSAEAGWRRWLGLKPGARGSAGEPGSTHAERLPCGAGPVPDWLVAQPWSDTQWTETQWADTQAAVELPVHADGARMDMMLPLLRS